MSTVPLPAAYQYLFDSYYGEVWRDDSRSWNGIKPKKSRGMHPTDDMIAYGDAVRAEERERCARAFEAEVDTWDEMKKAGFHGAIRRKGAAAIRALNPDGSTS